MLRTCGEIAFFFKSSQIIKQNHLKFGLQRELYMGSAREVLNVFYENPYKYRIKNFLTTTDADISQISMAMVTCLTRHENKSLCTKKIASVCMCADVQPRTFRSAAGRPRR